MSLGHDQDDALLTKFYSISLIKGKKKIIKIYGKEKKRGRGETDHPSISAYHKAYAILFPAYTLPLLMPYMPVFCRACHLK